MNKTFQTFIQYLRGSSRLGFRVLVGEKMNNINTDGLVKSLQSRRSRESGSPEVPDFPGFPRSRE